MTDSVSITKTYRDDHWVISAEIVPDPDNLLPASVFIYENVGTTALGAYQGVCSFEELQRLREWSGQIIPIFGNRFVRTNLAESHLSPGADPDRTVAVIRSGLASLKAELVASGQSSAVYPV